MVLKKKEKEDLVKWTSEIIKNSKGIAVVQIQGLNVNDATSLRSDLRKSSIGCKVIKNTLFARAMKNAKLDVSNDKIKGKTIALAYSDLDEVEPAKIVYNFSKKNENIKLLAGIVNEGYYNEEQVTQLAQLPSRDELYAKVVGSLSAPLSGMVNVLSGNLRGLVSVLKQYKEQKTK